jgi:hypothetical protein
MQLNSPAFTRKGFPSFGSFSKSAFSLSKEDKRKQENLSEDEEESACVHLLRRILLMNDDEDVIKSSVPTK